MNKKLISFAIIMFVMLFFVLNNNTIKRKISFFVPFIDNNYIVKPPKYIVNDSIHYFASKASLQKERVNLKNRYKKSTKIEKKEIIRDASAILYKNLADSLIPYWYGTPWDFNGITQKPGVGNIACGYFVFTLLRDAGIQLPRVKMSQAASEKAIKSLVPKNKIKRFSNISLNKFITDIKKLGLGFYIVGLDNHVGLLQIDSNNVWFIHSTAYIPRKVIKEKAEFSPALENSSYRVVGNLSDNDFLSKKWLLNQEIGLID